MILPKYKTNDILLNSYIPCEYINWSYDGKPQMASFETLSLICTAFDIKKSVA